MKIVNSDCLEYLKEMPDNSIDAIVTDPPYGLSFMGKKWDYDVPSQEIWEECLRVLKPGGYLLSFAGTRTQHRMAVRIEDAGFEIRDMIAWIYGSGFPKSLNIGKAVDKINGESDRELKFVKWFRATGLKQKETNQIIGKSDVGSHYLRLDQPAIPTRELWNILRPYIKIEIPQWVDELVERIEREREVLGQTITNKTVYQNIGGTNTNGEINVTKGNSEWEGWGTSLKPALEPITVARKPIEGNVAQNCLKWGVGGINIDGCRVDGTKEYLNGKGNPTQKQSGDVYGFAKYDKLHTRAEPNTQGRFPANLIHDGSDEVVGLFPNTKGATSRTPSNVKGVTNFGAGNNLNIYKDNTESAARFFMTCKYTPNDAIMKLCEDNIYANNAENSLPITNLIEQVVNIYSVLKSVPPNLDLLNQSLNALYAEKKPKNTVIDFVAKLVAISEVPEDLVSQEELIATQDFISNLIKCSQNQNCVDVEKWENINIIQIIINLLKLSGYVLLATDENTNSERKEVVGENGEPKRFAYIPKASKSERNRGCEDMEEKEWIKGACVANRNIRPNNPNSNNHPTVKPIALMEYLVKLVSKEGHTVLDPFMGSGSTGIACKKLNREFIGIELDADYCKIAEARIGAVQSVQEELI